MKIGSHDLNRDILIVAEIGNNHEGSFSLAEDMIGKAAGAGAHAVKFQTFQTEHYVSRRDEARYARLKRFELRFSDFERLAEVARRAGILFMSTPFDLESADFLSRIVSVFKISSGDLDFYPLLERVAAFGRPVILSSGMADLEQIRHSRAVISRIWSSQKIAQELAILHCVASYPTPPEQANLAVIPMLRERLGGIIGYSDHTIGIDAAVTAAAVGARIIEKHFTFDKNYSDFRDHQLSADPIEFAAMCRRIQEVKVLLGRADKRVQESEKVNAVAIRRSIVARRDLSRGALIRQEDLDWIRPAGGLPPGSEYLVVGKRLNCDLRAGDAITAQAVGMSASK